MRLREGVRLERIRVKNKPDNSASLTNIIVREFANKLSNTCQAKGIYTKFFYVEGILIVVKSNKATIARSSRHPRPYVNA